jgi:hypothetical protein
MTTAIASRRRLGKWALDRGNLITSYGLNWNVNETEWGPRQKPRGELRLLGFRGTGSDVRLADFWEQWGFYVLYGRRGAHYVGITFNLGKRLREHLSDELEGKWTKFSWFGIRELSKRRRGKDRLPWLQRSPKKLPVRPNRMVHDFEAVLFHAFRFKLKVAGNQKVPFFGGYAEKWNQVKRRDISKVVERTQAS